MPNLYGVSNPVIAPVWFQTPGGANVVPAANTETVIATSPVLAAISAGVYYPMIFGCVYVYAQSGALTGMTISARIGAGADFFQQGWQATAFPASAVVQLPFIAVGPNSTVPWQGAGSTLSVTALPTGNGCQIVVPGTYFWASLYRSPDQ